MYCSFRSTGLGRLSIEGSVAPVWSRVELVHDADSARWLA